jgi:hypothetical protein
MNRPRTPLVTAALAFGSAAADIGYIASRRIAIVPFLNGNSVSAYDLAAALGGR